jgi:hypothetical protein
MTTEDIKVLMILTMIRLAKLFGDYFDENDESGTDPSLSLKTEKQDNKPDNAVF